MIHTPTSDLKLRPLQPSDENDALLARDELAADGFEFLPYRYPDESWQAFTTRINQQSMGLGLPKGFVPCTFLVAVVSEQIVGRVSIRHRLNEKLRLVGGHIGYAVRPDSRRRGYGSEMLRQSLALCADLGIDRVLVTCDDDNTESAHVIERNSGVLQEVIPDPNDSTRLHRHYWISIEQQHR